MGIRRVCSSVPSATDMIVLQTVCTQLAVNEELLHEPDRCGRTATAIAALSGHKQVFLKMMQLGGSASQQALEYGQGLFKNKPSHDLAALQKPRCLLDPTRMSAEVELKATEQIPKYRSWAARRRTLDEPSMVRGMEIYPTPQKVIAIDDSYRAPRVASQHYRGGSGVAAARNTRRKPLRTLGRTSSQLGGPSGGAWQRCPNRSKSLISYI